MQNNWKYIFVQISVIFYLGSCLSGFGRIFFFKKSASVSIGQTCFLKMISLISTICGMFTRAHLADSGRYSAARISHAFCHWASFPVFWQNVVFSMCYHGGYQLSCKLLFRFFTVVLLGCCEVKPNITSVRIHVCSRIAMPHTAGAWWKASGSAKWDSPGCFG